MPGSCDRRFSEGKKNQVFLKALFRDQLYPGWSVFYVFDGHVIRKQFFIMQ